MNFIEEARQWRRWPVLIATVGTFVVIGYLDHRTGVQINLSACYLLPILFMTWRFGFEAGTALSLLGAAMTVGNDWMTDFAFSHPAYPWIDGALTFALFEIVVGLQHRLKRAYAANDQMARTDSLTGLANRRAFHERAELEISRLRRNRAPLTVAHLDLDGFKQINDRLGHQTGDRVLVAVAEALKQSRATDLPARLGGDEFAILMPETGGEAARGAVERLLSRLRESMRKNDWNVGFSFGVTTFMNTIPENADQLLIRADELTYEVKRTGKNHARYDTL